MFGHSFLIFHDEWPPESDSTIVEFTAETAQNSLSPVLALFSTIPGRYRLNQLYYKLREYDAEDRDVTIHRLLLSEEQRQLLTGELFARIDRPFGYQFTTFNCAYYMSDLISAAHPNMRTAIGFPLSLPSRLIGTFQSQGLLGIGLHIKSKQRTAVESFDGLRYEDKNLVASVLKGAAMPKKRANQPIVAAINAGADYLISRTSSPEDRKHLFLTRKKSFSLAPIFDPSPHESRETIAFQSSAIAASVRSFRMKRLISFRLMPLQRTFETTTRRDGLDSSLLEVGSLEISTHSRKVFLSQANIFRMSTATSAHFFRDMFARYVDLSYYDWQHSIVETPSSEAVARLGFGFASQIYDTKIATIPYVGLRYFKTGSTPNAIGPDFGIRSSIFSWVSGSLRAHILHLYYLASPFNFSNLTTISLALAPTAHINVGSEVIFADTPKDRSDFGFSSFVAYAF
jgi:hypothetical protein